MCQEHVDMVCTLSLGFSPYREKFNGKKRAECASNGTVNSAVNTGCCERR